MKAKRNPQQVSKCVLHMYDRNVSIEYMSNTHGRILTEITETEAFVNEALRQLDSGNDGDAVYHPLYKAWQSFVHNPAQLNEIQNHGKYGKGFLVFLLYGTINDIDEAQQIAKNYAAWFRLDFLVREKQQILSLVVALHVMTKYWIISNEKYWMKMM